MATVRNLACIAFRPEALDVHDLTRKLDPFFVSSFCRMYVLGV